METTRRAVVIGASIAGLVAARALADTFDKVTIVERDVLPDGPEFRRGVPQAKHLHGLLARGLTALEELFPGFADEMIAAGALPGDAQTSVHWYIEGHLLTPAPSGLVGIAVSRRLLEWKVRERLAALPGVEIIDNCDVLNLRTSEDRRQVTGVGIMSRVDGSAATNLAADLVVDASGRGSRTPVWLAELGYQPPAETRMTVDITYVTRIYRREPQHLNGRNGTSIGAFPGSPRAGFLMAMENDMFQFMISGNFGEQPPMDDVGLRDFVASLPARDFAEFLPTATRIGEPVKTRYPASVRRWYEKLTEFPAGYLVIGDALCSFNPVYGQGMTIAAVEAVMLRDLLRAGRADVSRRFFRSAAKLTDTAWRIATGSDMRFPQSGVVPPLPNRLFNRYLSRLYRVAATDAVVATAFIRVLNLVDTPDKLLAPAVLKRVFKRLPRNTSAVRETVLAHRAQPY